MTDYVGPERREDWHSPESCAKMVDVEKRFTDGTQRMKRIEDSITDLKTTQAEMMLAHKRFEEKLDANTATTEQAAKDNAEILDILTLGKSFFRLAGYFGTFVKWGSGIAVAVFTLWYTFMHGKPPP